ncbi:MAG: DUF4386 domain-containing protein [Methanobrevibacter sp.]|nr:DUF4386 domain-containing protein [Methanobrevibacter sp.]
MEEYRKIGIIVGILFIIGTVSGMASVALTGTITNSSEFIQITSNSSQFTLGALLILLMGISLAFIPIVLYPILKKENETLAIGYVIFRGALETVAHIAVFVTVLLLLDLPNMANLLIKFRDLATTSGTFVFSIGAIILYYALFRYKLVPRWLSLFGLVAITLHLITGFLIIFGLQTGFSLVNVIMNLPIIFQEMILAIWLIVKGFDLESGNMTKIKGNI